MKIISFIHVFTGIITLLASIAHAAPISNAKIVEINGSIIHSNKKLSGKAASQPVRVGNLIYEGATLTTGENSSAKFIFSNGSEVTLEQNSEIVFTKLKQKPFSGSKTYGQLSRDPSQSNTLININYGSLYAHVKKLARGSSFNVQTPLGVTIVKGTRFHAKFTFDTNADSFRFETSNVEGLVRVRSFITGQEVEFKNVSQSQEAIPAKLPASQTEIAVPQSKILVVTLKSDNPNYDTLIDDENISPKVRALVPSLNPDKADSEGDSDSEGDGTGEADSDSESDSDSEGDKTGNDSSSGGTGSGDGEGDDTGDDSSSGGTGSGGTSGGTGSGDDTSSGGTGTGDDSSSGGTGSGDDTSSGGTGTGDDLSSGGTGSGGTSGGTGSGDDTSSGGETDGPNDNGGGNPYDPFNPNPTPGPNEPPIAPPTNPIPQPGPEQDIKPDVAPETDPDPTDPDPTDPPITDPGTDPNSPSSGGSAPQDPIGSAPQDPIGSAPQDPIGSAPPAPDPIGSAPPDPIGSASYIDPSEPNFDNFHPIPS